jgi:hypothetical protein
MMRLQEDSKTIAKSNCSSQGQFVQVMSRAALAGILR